MVRLTCIYRMWDVRMTECNERGIEVSVMMFPKPAYWVRILDTQQNEQIDQERLDICELSKRIEKTRHNWTDDIRRQGDEIYGKLSLSYGCQQKNVQSSADVKETKRILEDL